MEAGIVHQLHQTLALTFYGLIEHLTGLTGITEVLVTTQIELFELTMDGCTRVITDSELLVFCQMEEYLRQLVRRIVVEVNGLREAALQTGVRIYEVVHLLRISGNDTHELSAVVLQAFQQCIDSLRTERVIVA